MQVLVVVAAVAAAAAVAATAARALVAPSIVLLLADDMGYGDPHYMGGPSLTPNMDAMAAAASTLRLMRHHSGSTTCSPTRATVMTGRVPERDCVFGPNVASDNPYQAPFTCRWPLRQKAPAFAHVAARTYNYSTLFLGKWHLGDVRVAQSSPSNFGFAQWVAAQGNLPTYDAPCFCETGSTSPCYAHKQNAACKGATCAWQHIYPRNHGVCGIRTCFAGHLHGVDLTYDWSCRMYQSPAGAQFAMPANLMSADVLTTLFEAFLDALTPAQPFFAVIAYNEPHCPFIASPALRAACLANTAVCANTTATPSSLAVDYFGALYAIDQSIGRVRSALQAAGRRDDTLVLFSSDNGPEEFRLGGYGSTGGLSGRKRSILEGGHRVPGLLEWPRLVTANRVVTQPTSTLDWAPTLLDVLATALPAVPRPAAVHRDGVSLLPLVLAPGSWTRPRPLPVCASLLDSQSPRAPLCQVVALIDGHMKLVGQRAASRYVAAKLFDLDKDAAELVDLRAAQPHVAANLTAQVNAIYASVLADSAAC